MDFLTFVRNVRSRIRVTSDVIFPGQQGPQIIAADIGEPDSKSRPNSIHHIRNKSFLSLSRNRAARSGFPPELITIQPSIAEQKVNFRRLSKMVLAGYGGASLLFFGVSPSSFGNAAKNSVKAFARSADAMAREKKSEETKLADAIEASEAEAAGDAFEEPEEKREYSWWDVLLGKHDQEIFERSTAHHDEHHESKRGQNHKGKMKATAVIIPPSSFYYLWTQFLSL